MRLVDIQKNEPTAPDKSQAKPIQEKGIREKPARSNYLPYINSVNCV